MEGTSVKVVVRHRDPIAATVHPPAVGGVRKSTGTRKAATPAESPGMSVEGAKPREIDTVGTKHRVGMEIDTALPPLLPPLPPRTPTTTKWRERMRHTTLPHP